MDGSFHGYVSPNQMVYGFIWIYDDLTDCASFPQAMPGLICAVARSNHLVHHVHHVFPLFPRFALAEAEAFQQLTSGQIWSKSPEGAHQ